MGEVLTQIVQTLNNSIRIEGRNERLSAETGALPLRLDVDSLPTEVDGYQPGAEYNGHYGAKIFHPLIATAAELGDILDVKLPPGTVHTAEGGLDFILNLVKESKTKLCQINAVRMDAGFPDEQNA